MRHILRILVLAVALIEAGQGSAWAQGKGWTVTNDGNEFTIRRSSSSGNETVYYRTVSLSAMDGENYTVAWGSLTFNSGESTKTVTVQETGDVRDYRFLFHDGTGRGYRFEVLNESVNTVLASCVRKLYNSDRITINGSYMNKGIVDLVKLSNGNFASGLNGSKYYDVVFDHSVDRYRVIKDTFDYDDGSVDFLTTDFLSRVCNVPKGHPLNTVLIKVP